jgi:hypothetical protein
MLQHISALVLRIAEITEVSLPYQIFVASVGF